MKCPRCGFDNPPDTRFCGRCGTPLVTEAVPPGPTATMTSPVHELETGSTFAGRYQIIEELGKGGMGRVYKVFDTEVKEKLALKLLKPEIAGDAATIERFRSELRLARTVSHRNVCRMHDLGREEATGTYYITMEYVAGEDLKGLIHRIGALPLGKALAIARQVAEGLAEAHRLAVVHRDLKPQHIMIDREGGVRIMDFGIARLVGAKGITGAGIMVGTPEYMSPEQVDGKEPDARSDIYSLGVVLFEMLTGRVPFEGETALAVAMKQKSEPPPDPRGLNPQIPEELRDLVLRCLKKDKRERYQNVDDLQAELARIERCMPETTGARPSRKPQTSKEITVRLPSKRIWIPVAAALTVLAALLVWQFIPTGAASRRTLTVIGFKNQTGDPGLDYLREAIPNLLITSLEQSKHLRVVSWERLKDLLKQAGRESAAIFNEEAGFEVCRREGIEALVVGSYIKAGDTFVTDVKVLDTKTRESLRSASARGDGVASILKTQIDEISREVGRGIGKPLLKLEAPARPIMDLTTDSMEAYNYFLRGREDLEKFYFADALKYLERAIALDPDFALAHMILSYTAGQLSDLNRRDEALRAAFRHSASASEKERLYIAAQFAGTIERDENKRFRMLQELVRKFPDEKYALWDLGRIYEAREDFAAAVDVLSRAIALDPEFGSAINLLAYTRARMGEFGEALRLFERYAAVSPGDANPLDSMAELYVRMGNLGLAEAKYREALELKPDFFISCANLAYVASLREDYPETYRWLDEFDKRAPEPALIESQWLRAFVDYLLGRWQSALSRYDGLRKAAEAAGIESYVATADWITAFIYRDMGRSEDALTAYAGFNDYAMSFTADTDLSRATQAFFTGWVDVARGRVTEAAARLAEMESSLSAIDDPGGTPDITFLYSLLRAEVELADYHVDRAIALGKEIVFPNFPTTTTPNMVNYNLPFVKDVLARAYWKKGDLDAAAAEYRKLTTIDPSNNLRMLISPLYHYRLGRVLEDKGDEDGAVAEYRKFLEYWKDADSTHPELADAHKRLDAIVKPLTRHIIFGNRAGSDIDGN